MSVASTISASKRGLARWALPADEGARRRRDRVLAALFLLSCVVLVLRAARKDEGVLARNREFGARFLAHADPYEDPARGHRVHGPYPPSYALVTVPLALVPEPVARAGWALLQVGALAAAFALVRRWLARGWPTLAPHASVVYACALLLASRYLLRDMAGGGGNLLYGVGAAWGVELALSGRTWPGAFALALPLVLKPNLAPLTAFLLARRRFGAFAATLVAAAVLAAAPALVYGASDYAALVERWTSDLASFARAVDLNDPASVPEGFPLADTTMNQSVRESLWRAFDPATAAWLARAAVLGLLGTAGALAWRARGVRAELQALAAFLCVCVLASPISWKAHHVALLPAFAVLVASALEPRRRWLAWLLVVYDVACVLLSEELVGKDAKNQLQAWSIVTWGALALVVASAVLVLRREAPTRE